MFQPTRNIRKTIRSHDHSLPPYIPQLLILSSLAGNANRNAENFYSLILNVFEFLDKIPMVQPLLKALACLNDFKIVFDFENEIDDTIEVRKDFKQNYISIGSKKFLDEEKACEAYGILAHEMCHLAMRLLYNNDYLPYFKGDHQRKQEFNRITMFCEEDSEKEEIIGKVFKLNSKKIWQSELIVRVPQLIAHYSKQPEKLSEIHQEFTELFEFYESKVLVDLEKEFRRIELKKEISDTNDLCGLELTLKKSKVASQFNFISNLKLQIKGNESVKMISSNCVPMTLVSLYQAFDDCPKVFVMLYSLRNKRILNCVLKTYNLSIRPWLIIDCDQETSGKVSEVMKMFARKNIKSRVILVINEELKVNKFPLKVDKCLIKHKWNQLTRESKEVLLNSFVSFQGKEIALSKLLVENSSAAESIPFKEMLMNKKIKIGKSLKDFELEFYIERKFLANETCLTKELPLESLIDKCQEKIIILIGGTPGSGKTFALTEIARQLKNRFPSHWIVHLGLKYYTNCFQKDENSSTVFEEISEVTNFLTNQLMQLDSFESKIFTDLFFSDRVMFLFDGFDDISPSFKEFVLKLAIGIHHKTKNQIWITTRLHLLHELEQRMTTSSFKLVSFTEKEQKDFLLKFGAFKTHNIEMQLKFTARFDSFLKLINSSILNPLLLQMIANFASEEAYRNLAATIRQIYDMMTIKMFSRCIDEGVESLKSLTGSMGKFSILDVFQKMAFETLLCNYESTIGGKVNAMLNLNLPHVQLPSADQAYRIGILFADVSGEVRFIHRSFAEFFVAEFIYQRVFLEKFAKIEDFKSIVEVLAIICLNVLRFQTILAFIDSALIRFKPKARPETSEVREVFSKVFKGKPVLGHLVEQGFGNLITVMLKYFFGDSREQWLDQRNHILEISAEKHQLDFNEQMWKLANEALGSEELKQSLKTKDKNILNCAMTNEDDKVFGFYYQNLKEIFVKEDLKDFVKSKNEHGHNVLFTTIAYQKTNNLRSVILALLTNLDLAEIRTEVEVTDVQNWTYLHHLATFQDQTGNKKLLELFFEVYNDTEAENLALASSSTVDSPLQIAIERNNAAFLVAFAGPLLKHLLVHYNIVEVEEMDESKKE